MLCLHGFTGNPSSMRPVAEAFAAAGFSVELPRLPGHGTTVEDMMTTTWTDWSTEAEAAYQRLAARCTKVVVSGLSMGGSLTLWLASRHPEIAAVVPINPAVRPQGSEMVEMLCGFLAQGLTTIPGIGADLADPDATESAYEATPVVPLISLMNALAGLGPELGKIACPMLLMTSPQDHVVPPGDSDHLAEVVVGPVERVTLERSYHVATLDFDRALICERAVAFAAAATAAS